MKSIPLVLAAAALLAVSCKKEESYLEKRERERAEKAGKAERVRAEKTEKPQRETSETGKPAVQKSDAVTESKEDAQLLLSARDLALRFQLDRAKFADSRRRYREAKRQRVTAGTLTDAWLADYVEVMRKSDAIWQNASTRESLAKLLQTIKDPETAEFIRTALEVDQHLRRSDEYSTEVTRLWGSPAEDENLDRMLELSEQSIQELRMASKLVKGMNRSLTGEAATAPE